MKIEIIPEVGDKYRVVTHGWRGFAFMNKHGGTGLSDTFVGEAIVEITKVWYDYETGYRCWAKAISQDLIKYLDVHAHPKDKRVFVGQFDIEILK